MRLAALIALYLLITAPMLWHIVSADVLHYQTCSKATCKLVDEKAGPFHDAEGAIASAGIAAISESLECLGKCTNLDASGKQIHIMGNYRTVMCQAWGGMFCVYGGEK